MQYNYRPVVVDVRQSVSELLMNVWRDVSSILDDVVAGG